jgi:hypothetical protein
MMMTAIAARPETPAATILRPSQINREKRQPPAIMDMDGVGLVAGDALARK